MEGEFATTSTDRFIHKIENTFFYGETSCSDSFMHNGIQDLVFGLFKSCKFLKY